MATGHWQRARLMYQDKVVVRCQETARKQQVLGRSPVLVYCQRATGATCKAMQGLAWPSYESCLLPYGRLSRQGCCQVPYRYRTCLAPGECPWPTLGPHRKKPAALHEAALQKRRLRGSAKKQVHTGCSIEQLAAGWTRNRLGRVLLLVWKCASEPRLLFLSLWKTSEEPVAISRLCLSCLLLTLTEGVFSPELWPDRSEALIKSLSSEPRTSLCLRLGPSFRQILKCCLPWRRLSRSSPSSASEVR